MIAMYTFTALLVLIVGADSFALMNHRNSQSRRSKSLSLVRDAVPRSSIEVEKMEKSRAMVSLVGLTAGLLMGQLGGPRKAEALDLFPSADQQAVNAVSAFQKPVYELLNQLRPYDTPNALGIYSKQQILKGGQDDSNVVLLYLINYITPLQKKMEEVASILKLGGPEQERLETLPKLMLGHSLELKEAIKSLKAEEQLKEVEEVWETLQEFLKLASASGKYKVDVYVDIKQISDKDLMGPLGCEFWGKKRAEGSNACVELN